MGLEQASNTLPAYSAYSAGKPLLSCSRAQACDLKGKVAENRQFLFALTLCGNDSRAEGGKN
jgi:hypothetical protein